jgi:methionine-rich copper-binding protein CopC
MSKPAGFFVVLAIVSLAASAAGAHAFLDHANPAVGSTIHGAPVQLQIWFTQELEPAFSTVTVTDSSGAQIDKNDKHVDANDPTLLEVSLPQLPPGDYTVNWRALSVDTHITEGKFTFTVAP